MIKDTNSYYVGPNEKSVYLTFDAGYDNGMLDKILDTLKEKNVTASFFVTGDFIKRFPNLVLRIFHEGHSVCNHSYSHKKITSMSKDELGKDLKKLEDENFTIKGQILSREDKVNYCYNNIINSYYDADSLEYNELRTYNKYYKTLKNTSSIEEKIKYISLLYTMTGREHLLVYELYKYLTNDV